MVRSLAGPSGKVVGNKFALDEIRNRFRYPHDKRFVIYFEWEGPEGEHTLTGRWIGPDGRTVSISSDIRLQAATREFGAYWTYEIITGIPSGVWSLDVRIDGVPAGSHSFELIVPGEAVAAAAEAQPPKIPTPDEIYRRIRSSIVWVHKRDESGRRIDSGSGFVIGPNQIATAFQVIDAGWSIEVEFETGRKAATDELWGWNRLQDWAVLKVDTADASPLPLGDASKVSVTQQLLVFNVDNDRTHVFGGVDFAGRRTVANFGERLQLAPVVAAEAVGGPLLNTIGEVVGVLGGTTFPGARFGRRDLALSPSLYSSATVNNRATPIQMVRIDPVAAANLSALRRSGILSAPVVSTPSFLYGSTSVAFKGARDALPKSVSEFSHKDAEIWVYSMWQRNGKVSKGLISAEIYDAANRARVKVAPKKINLPADVPLRYGFSFSPLPLEVGPYRVDVQFDGLPVWRTFFTITD